MFCKGHSCADEQQTGLLEIMIPFTRGWIRSAYSRISETHQRIHQADVRRIDLLSQNILEQILSFLPVDSICCVSKSCSSLLFVCMDDSFWFQACSRQSVPCCPSVYRDQLGLRSYKAVYVALSAILHLQGHWQILQDYPYGHLIVVRYHQGQVVAEKYTPESGSERAGAQMGSCRG